jgi:hypothetical protein
VDLVLAWRVWRSNPKHPVNIYFALAVLMAAFWTAGAIGIQSANSPLVIGWSAKIAYISGFLAGFFFLFFTYHFPYKIVNLSTGYLIVLILTALTTVLLMLLPNVFLATRVSPSDRFSPEISTFWHIIFTIIDMAVILLSFKNLLLSYKHLDGIWKKRIRQIIVGTLIAFLGGTIFSLIIPLIYNNSLNWLGPVFSLFMAGYIWYHIFWKTNRA